MEEERAWTDNYPRVPASSNPISPRVVEKGWTVKNSVTIIKTVDMVDPGWRTGSIRCHGGGSLKRS